MRRLLLWNGEDPELSHFPHSSLLSSKGECRQSGCLIPLGWFSSAVSETPPSLAYRIPALTLWRPRGLFCVSLVV